MSGRARISRKSKTQHRKRTGPKPSNARTASRRSHRAAQLQEQLDQRTRELANALQEQTATPEILRVISTSPGELEPVFKPVLENTTSLCEAAYGNLYLREGDAFRLMALHGSRLVAALEH